MGKIREALIFAYHCELNALNQYQKIIQEFGAVSPFSYVIQGKEKHLRTLFLFFERYYGSIPPLSKEVIQEKFGSIEAAWKLGVKLETQVIQSYEDLLLVNHGTSAGKEIFSEILKNSQNGYLPAFQRSLCCEKHL